MAEFARTTFTPTRMLRRVVSAMVAVVAVSTGLTACTVFDRADGVNTVQAVQAVSTSLDDFVFESMDVEYTLGRDADGASTLEVVERFVAVFPDYDQNRGMRRSIPDSYQGIPVHPDLVSITDEEGDPRPAEVDSEDGTFMMTSRADDFVHGTQTYVFTYTLENVTRYFADVGVDEFYWDVNGSDWRQPFGSVTATLHLDQALSSATTGMMACYFGYEGSTDQCMMDALANADGSADVFAQAGPVGPYQNMTIAVGFEKGTFAAFDDSFLASPFGWLQLLAALGVLAGLLWAIVVRRGALRDEPGRPTIVAEYTPPAHIDALESAVLLRRPSKAIPAEVLEQAVVGSIRIIEGERRFFSRARLQAQLVDPSLADGDGRMLLSGLFPMGIVGEVYEFGGTDRRFSVAAQAILKAAGTELVRRGLRRKVRLGTQVLPVIVTGLAGLGVFFAGMAALDNAVSAWLPIGLIAGAVIAEITVIGMMSHKPLTALGAEVRDHLAGLREFIEWAEADRIRMLQSPQGAERVRIDTTDRGEMLKLYETLLPFAVVFGQEKQWSKELAVLYGSDHSPGWYSGSSGFNASAFAAGIGTLSSSASSSSSSGGSSGGGSSGGGGGGGGGGGV